MPKRGSEAGTVVCPACGHRFRLDEQVVDHVRQEIESELRQRLKREVRDELTPDVERKARRLTGKELREKDEEVRERDRQIATLKRQVTNLSKKLPAPRAQALGDIRQETLVQQLASRCGHDDVTAIAKGARGADIVQTVRGPDGRACGTILWEVKRATKWSNGWVRKLRNDQRQGGHTLAAIVSDALPQADCLLTDIDGVWVCDTDIAADLAVLLRATVIEVSAARGARARRSDLKGLAYDYLAGPDFAAHIRAVVENTTRMRANLEHERRALQVRWAEREQQIEGVVSELAGVYGDLRGLGTALPAVAQLELPAPVEQA